MQTRFSLRRLLRDSIRIYFTPLIGAVKGMRDELRRLDGTPHLRLTITTERETDGRWLAEIDGLPGVMAYGSKPAGAQSKAQALAFRVLADRLDAGESGPVDIQIRNAG